MSSVMIYLAWACQVAILSIYWSCYDRCLHLYRCLFKPLNLNVIINNFFIHLTVFFFTPSPLIIFNCDWVSIIHFVNIYIYIYIG